MPEILHDFPVNVLPTRVFDAFATPAGLDSWWTLKSTGRAMAGGEFELHFGPGYDWRARVTRYEPTCAIELTLTHAMDDWVGSKVGVRLEPTTTGTQVHFYHSGWAESSEHFRTSSFCWAMYLRVMKRNLEFGEVVPYDDRLKV